MPFLTFVPLIILSEKNLKESAQRNCYTLIRMTNQENITSFKQELAKQACENEHKAENVHEAYGVFMKKL